MAHSYILWHCSEFHLFLRQQPVMVLEERHQNCGQHNNYWSYRAEEVGLSPRVYINWLGSCISYPCLTELQYTYIGMLIKQTCSFHFPLPNSGNDNVSDLSMVVPEEKEYKLKQVGLGQLVILVHD